MVFKKRMLGEGYIRAATLIRSGGASSFRSCGAGWP